MRVKNWDQFQHYKDRNPIWIKLYKSLIDDPDYHDLPDKSAKCLPLIWLIASENNGELPPMERLAFRLRMTLQQTEKVVYDIKKYLEQDDSNLIATCTTDKIREEEIRGDKSPQGTDTPQSGKKQDEANEANASSAKQNESTQKTQAFSEKPKSEPRFVKPTLEQVRAYCQERKNAVDPNKFVNYYDSKGWLVGKTPMKDWKAAVRTWEGNTGQNGQQSQPEEPAMYRRLN